MLNALMLGIAAQSALLLSGLVVYALHIPDKLIGALAGYGAGALIEAIAFDLVAQARHLSGL